MHPRAWISHEFTGNGVIAMQFEGQSAKGLQQGYNDVKKSWAHFAQRVKRKVRKWRHLDFAGQSDKSFRHGYIDFYENYFPKSIGGLIIEFGVLQGDSIRWLAKRFINANILGLDIVEQKKSWPTGERIAYRKIDQGSEEDIKALFKDIDAPELIIEDGSHIPSHQLRCFKHGFAALKPGGMYILEDIHTSLPEHSIYQEWKNSLPGAENGVEASALQTSLTIILAFEHLKRLQKEKLSHEELDSLSKDEYFSHKELRDLYAQIDSIHVYRRATLPTGCPQCRSTEFNYNAYRCKCGAYLYDLGDSMAAVIIKK